MTLVCRLPYDCDETTEEHLYIRLMVAYVSLLAELAYF